MSIKNNIQPRYLTVKQAEIYSGHNRNRLLEFRKEGVNGIFLPYFKIKGRVMYDRIEIDRFMQQFQLTAEAV